ncbi:MAG: GAF domain-containing protein, partial [Proteobacteria bacterium]
PAEYNAIVHGMEIGNDRGSCGTAAYLSQTVIAADIATDPRWAAFKDIALNFGLASCWSSPIISSENKVLGTFALYRPQPGEPTGNDRKLVEVATRTAAIILERHEANEKRRAAEIALRTSQERLALSLTSGGIGFWEWNAKTGYVFLSETLMDDWGIDPEKYQNTLPECLERIHPEDRDSVWKEINNSALARVNYDVEYRVIRPGGATIWINAKGKFLIDDAGAAERLSGVTINITERKRAEEELRSAVRARDQFLSIASHELKTPLTSLRLQAQLHKRAIAKKDPTAYSAPRVDSIVEQTEKQVNRLTRLVDDMLDVSRIRSGQLTLEREPFALGTLTEEIAGRLKNQFLAAGYPEPQIHSGPATEGSWDRLRIEQVITNLLTNAIRYGKKNPVSVKVESLGAAVRLSVEDGGIGIAPEAREKIFDRFERAVDANEVSGLGLGLFISKQIVSAHGGKIWVENRDEGGSRFVLELPKEKLSTDTEEVVNVL